MQERWPGGKGLLQKYEVKVQIPRILIKQDMRTHNFSACYPTGRHETEMDNFGSFGPASLVRATANRQWGKKELAPNVL